jgi:hypothetical protein
MSRHVVGPFQCVEIVGTVFGYQPVKYRFHVVTHIRIAVLIDRESATGVLDKDVH